MSCGHEMLIYGQKATSWCIITLIYQDEYCLGLVIKVGTSIDRNKEETFD